MADDEIDQEGSVQFATKRSHLNFLNKANIRNSLHKLNSIQRDSTSIYIGNSSDSKLSSASNSAQMTKFAADYVEMSLNKAKEQIMTDKTAYLNSEISKDDQVSTDRGLRISPANFNTGTPSQFSNKETDQRQFTANVDFITPSEQKQSHHSSAKPFQIIETLNPEFGLDNKENYSG